LEEVLFSGAYVELVEATDAWSFGSIFWEKTEGTEAT